MTVSEWNDGGERVRIRRIRCPKCSCSPTSFIEVGSHFTFFSAGPDWRDDEGVHEPGEYTHVLARCECGHRWKLRGVKQIIGLDVKPTSPATR